MSQTREQIISYLLQADDNNQRVIAEQQKQIAEQQKQIQLQADEIGRLSAAVQLKQE